MKVEFMKMWRKPLDADEFEPPKGTVYVIEERCKGCNFCIEFCPMEVLEESERFNSKGYHPPEVVNPEDCVDCGLCELICPEFAIFVLDAKEVEANKRKRKNAKGSKAKRSGHNKKEGSKGSKKPNKKGASK
jgi:2-oxoglutarate ferredoxin oxidoreductase subunit delta